MTDDHRSPTWWNRLHRWVARWALQVAGASALMVVTVLATCARGVFETPGRISNLEAQVNIQFDLITKRQKVDSARTDSLYRINAGVLSVLCFGITDRAFEAAKLICGEAFTVSRIIAGERVQKERRP